MPDNLLQRIFTNPWQVIFVVILISLGVLISTGNDQIALVGICIVGMALLYRFNFEFFILGTLIINHEFFFLAPREVLGRGNYQDALYLILLLILPVSLLKRKSLPRNITLLVVAFFPVIFFAVLLSTLDGQPWVLGLKAAKGYYLLLFFFVFFSRPIDVPRLTRMVVLTGVLLMILNNIQYIFWGSLHLFYDPRQVLMARSGRLRFLVGNFFTIFISLSALGIYLQQKKRWYLAAFLYMTATVFIQGQTRAVIIGMTLTTLVLFFLSRRTRSKRFMSVLAIIAGLILFSMMLKETFMGSLFRETTLEFAQKSGNVGVRYDTYDYYWKELSQHIVTGRGIWNDTFNEYNPENMKYIDLHLSDIGIMGFLFHTGLIGFAWLVALLIMVYRVHFASLGRLRMQINYGIIGYFIFSAVTLVTLNGLVSRTTIIYLALALAIMAQYGYDKKIENRTPSGGKSFGEEGYEKR